MNKWPVEEIPDDDILYYRIHKNVIEQAKSSGHSANKLPPEVFRYQGGDLSVQWKKYTTAQAARGGGRSPAHENGIVEFTAGPVRGDGHKVVHSPSSRSRAHSSIRGNEPDVRITLSRIAIWKIKV